MSHYHENNDEAPAEPGDVSKDVTWLRRASAVFFVVFLFCIGLAAYASHQRFHSRPQVAVIAPEAPVIKQEERAPAILPPEARPTEVAPTEVAPAPDVGDIRPSAGAPVEPVTDAHPVEAPTANVIPLQATTADEAQHAQDLIVATHHRLLSFFRPHHHHHHHQPRRHAHAGGECGGGPIEDFFCDAARLAGLIQ